MHVKKILELLDCIANFRDENGNMPFGTIDYQSISDCRNELRANASLIDAAPDLLEAARFALHNLYDFSHMVEAGMTVSDAIKTLENAIAKAENKS